MWFNCHGARFRAEHLYTKRAMSSFQDRKVPAFADSNAHVDQIASAPGTCIIYSRPLQST